MIISSETAAVGSSLNVGILLLNAERGSCTVARQHASDLLSFGHSVTIMHPDMGLKDHVEGVDNIAISLEGMPTPVHEDVRRERADQRPVSEMSLVEASKYIPCYEKALNAVAPKLDLIIGHHGSLSAVAVQRVAEHFKKPYALFIHGGGPEARLGHHSPYRYDDHVWSLIAASMMTASGIMVTTDYVRDSLIRPLVDYPMDRFFVHPIGVDLEEFDASGAGDIKTKYGLPDRYVIAPGPLTRLKGSMDIANASKRYSDLAHTVFFGNGPLKDKIRAELGDRGTLLGFIPNEDKAGLIAGAILLLGAPLKKEHFGIIYAEALAASTPVVAYEGGGVNSIVTEDVGALTPRDPESLGNTVRRMLEDPSSLNAMSRAARTRAETLFNRRKLRGKLNERILSWAVQS